jgi:uncharacterized protein
MNNALANPCISTCVVDPKTGYCIGCGRTSAEITAWATLDAAARASALDVLPARLAAMTSRRVRTKPEDKRYG